jgi:hypothetical protein
MHQQSEVVEARNQNKFGLDVVEGHVNDLGIICGHQ